MWRAQLLTAMPAAVTGESFQRDVDFEDHLVIHDLYAPNGQDEDFARCIERLARSIAAFNRIHYLNPRDIAALQQTGKSVANLLDLDSVHEMYLGQNRVVLNRLLADAFPH